MEKDVPISYCSVPVFNDYGSYIRNVFEFNNTNVILFNNTYKLMKIIDLNFPLICRNKPCKPCAIDINFKHVTLLKNVMELQ